MKKILCIIAVLVLLSPSHCFAITHGVLEQKPDSIKSPLVYLCAVRTLKLLDQFFYGNISSEELNEELKIINEICPVDRGIIDKEMGKLVVLQLPIETDEDLEWLISCYDALYNKVYGVK